MASSNSIRSPSKTGAAKDQMKVLLVTSILLLSLVVHPVLYPGMAIVKFGDTKTTTNDRSTIATSITTRMAATLLHKNHQTVEAVLEEFDDINTRLIGPIEFTENYRKICGFDKDCPRHYSVRDIYRSAEMMEEYAGVLIPYANEMLLDKTRQAAMQCAAVSGDDGRRAMPNGSWCKFPDPSKALQTVNDPTTGQVLFSPPLYHMTPSQRIIDELIHWIQDEDIESINDFGAGVGSYKVAALKAIPDGLKYRAYDGAGNIECYTNYFVRYADLTIPLALPKADWVLSLEVGEHIPSSYEGVFLRNLHLHNCKGIILSWAVLKQGGHKHVNVHTNEYVVDIMNDLGYENDIALQDKFRNPANNRRYFEHSVMAFRRRTSIC